MAGITPKASDHANLPPQASRFVDVAGLPWEKTSFQGVEQKTLLIDRDSGLLTVLLKMAPGAKLPDHEHVLIEQTYLLSGTLVCGEGTVTAGNFVAPGGQPARGLGGAGRQPVDCHLPDTQPFLPRRWRSARLRRQRLGEELGRRAAPPRGSERVASAGPRRGRVPRPGRGSCRRPCCA